HDPHASKLDFRFEARPEGAPAGVWLSFMDIFYPRRRRRSIIFSAAGNPLQTFFPLPHQKGVFGKAGCIEKKGDLVGPAEASHFLGVGQGDRLAASRVASNSEDH